MCGRYALASSPVEIARHFSLHTWETFDAGYNIAPGSLIPVIRQSPENQRVLHRLTWGLLPHWAKDPTIAARLNNARGESVSDKPAFRDAFSRRRCLIPASGFFEWKTEGKLKQPFYISLRSGEPMALGGLWESWRSPDGSILRPACIVTVGPNAVMAPIHDRMPVILSPDTWQDWLSAPAADILPRVTPCPAALLQAWPVDRRVNKTAENDPDLIRPLP
jgi:putative SOS response-associated peptidase YedK